MNTEVDGLQLVPDVTALENDGFVAAWGAAYTYAGIRARRIAAGGQPLASDFLISAQAGRYLDARPVVAGTPESGFLVAWRKLPVGPEAALIAGRLFDSEAQPYSDDFVIAAPTGARVYPSIASHPGSSSYLVLWEDLDVAGVGGRRYGPECPLGCDPFSLDPPDQPVRVGVAAGIDGGFVIVWDILENYTFGNAVQLQRVGIAGDLLGSPVQVNQIATSYAQRPAVGAAASGDFLVVWTRATPETLQAVHGRMVNSEGQPVADEFQISDPTFAWSTKPRVSGGDPVGTFVVVWQGGNTIPPYVDHPGSDGSSSSIDGRLIRNGRPAGSAFTVNAYTTSSQEDPDIARNARGEYLIVWESSGSFGDDSSGTSINARVFRDNSGVFADGFESGDDSAWTDSFSMP